MDLVQRLRERMDAAVRRYASHSRRNVRTKTNIFICPSIPISTSQSPPVFWSGGEVHVSSCQPQFCWCKFRCQTQKKRGRTSNSRRLMRLSSSIRLLPLGGKYQGILVNPLDYIFWQKGCHPCCSFIAVRGPCQFQSYLPMHRIELVQFGEKESRHVELVWRCVKLWPVQ